MPRMVAVQVEDNRCFSSRTNLHEGSWDLGGRARGWGFNRCLEQCGWLRHTLAKDTDPVNLNL